MEQLRHMPQPTEPLYKYLSLAENQTPSWQSRLTQLFAGECFLPSAADFNDPFDCIPYADTPSSREDIAAGQERLVSQMAEAIRRHLPAQFVEGKIREHLRAKSPEEINDGFQMGIRKNAESMGVFCLAECIDSVLMWSHYASNHSGIALRFDFRRQVHGGLAPLWKVQYQADRPVLSHFFGANPSDPDSDRKLPDALATKALFWAYEQEWRSMKPDRARQTVRFNPEVITGLVLGASCRADNEEWIRSFVKGRGLDLERVQPNRKTFELSLVPA